MRTLARKLRDHPSFSTFLNDQNIQLLAKSAPLHDIGEVGIPDHILLKSGKLTPEEWEIMKTHARLGGEALEQAERDAERPIEFLALAKEIAHYHHERRDGGGYPEGLVGEAIPLSARLMALADVFDALITRRAYKPPMPHAQGPGPSSSPTAASTSSGHNGRLPRALCRVLRHRRTPQRKRRSTESETGLVAGRERRLKHLLSPENGGL